MKLGKMTRVIILTLLISTLGIFTSSAYGYNNAQSIKNSNIEPIVIKNIFSDELKNFKEGNKIINNYTDKKEINIADNISDTSKQSQVVLSRGGSGLNIKKQQVKAKAITANKTSSKAINEVDLFSRLVSAEASGESFEGQLAVATVIINRVKSSEFPSTITGVIMDKNWGYQFSPILDGRINEPATASAKKAVNMVLSGYRSFESDITYFVNPKKAESTWIIKNKTFFKSIGNHDFYR